MPFGKGNVTMVDLKGNSLDSFIHRRYAAGPQPAAGTHWPAAGHPFCSPAGVLIIIPPICDEIGVDWPPGSLQNQTAGARQYRGAATPADRSSSSARPRTATGSSCRHAPPGPR